MSKVILISSLSLPYAKIGSWTTLYGNYLRQDHQIDYIICPQPPSYYDGIKYAVARRDVWGHIKKRLSGRHYDEYFKQLRAIIKPGENYVIQIVDNPGMALKLGGFLSKYNLDRQCFVQFFYHGYGPFFNNHKSRTFFKTVDEMIMLTADSYKFYTRYYDRLPCRFSVLHNGIDTEKFRPAGIAEKEMLKAKYNGTGKTIFLWCSQDRPKKGLELILEAWSTVFNEKENIELWVVGANRARDYAGVKFFGRIPNDQLPEIYQASDAYLYPTLCHEGFGMSLIEAMHCGNYCIASAIGGVSEVLQYGKLGVLVQNPNFVDEWVQAIIAFLDENTGTFDIPRDLYSTHNWNDSMNQITSSAKRSLEARLAAGIVPLTD